MVQAQPPSLLSLKFWQKFVHHPGLIVVVVGDESIVLVCGLFVLMSEVIEPSQKEIIGVDQLPSHEMEHYGGQHETDNRTCGGHEADETSVHHAG